MKINRSKLTAHENNQLLDTIYVGVERDGDDAYRATWDCPEDVVEAGDKDGEIVATYKLVKIEKLALKRSTKIVKVA